jgi:hypothetical protein
MAVPEAVALEIPAEEGSPAARVPPRIRRRLAQARESSVGAPATAEEIEARLRDAHLRRQVGLLFPIFFSRCVLRDLGWVYVFFSADDCVVTRLRSSKWRFSTFTL